MKEQRSCPQLTRLASAHGERTATLVSGWIRSEKLPLFVERVALALGEAVPRDEAARIVASLPTVPEDVEGGLEWQLPFRKPLLAHFVPVEALIAVDVLLEGERELHVEAVHEAFATCTVDPRAA